MDIKPSTFYIVMWNVMSHCDVYQGLHFTRTLSSVKYHITILIHGLLQCLVNICQQNQRRDTLIMGQWRLISVMSHCDIYHTLCNISHIHQGLCHILIFVKGYVTLR